MGDWFAAIALIGCSFFKGIPYARAKRFHASGLVEVWDGIFDAGSFGVVCPLLNQEKPKVKYGKQ